MSDLLIDAPAHATSHHHHHHGALTAADRHQHEAETYDAMAQAILSDWTEADYLVSPERIPFPNREHVDYLGYAVAQLGPLSGRRILEVGAGNGSLAVWLALQGADVTAVDVSAGILEVSTRRAEINGVADRTHFVHSPIETFDPSAAGLPDTPFDAIIGNNVVHHFERDAALQKLGDLLAPGALAVFCEPVLFVPEWMRSARNSAIVTRRFPPHTHSPDERSLDRHDLELVRRWFRHVEVEPFGVLTRIQNFVELSDPMWNRLESADRILLRRASVLHHLCRMVVLTLGLPKEASTS